ncbi:hypothetical protein EV182_006130, partial [Spiromyces aspiralis]
LFEDWNILITATDTGMLRWTSLGNAESPGQLYLGHLGQRWPVDIATPTLDSIYTSTISGSFTASPKVIIGSTARTKVFDLREFRTAFNSRALNASGMQNTFPLLWSRSTNSDTLAVAVSEEQVTAL